MEAKIKIKLFSAGYHLCEETVRLANQLVVACERELARTLCALLFQRRRVW